MEVQKKNSYCEPQEIAVLISQTLPSDPGLQTIKLGQSFKNTTNAYKFYWFLGILDAVVKEGTTVIDAEDIACRMICSVWYPVHYFRLRFGALDQLSESARSFKDTLKIPVQTKEDKLFQLLKQHAEPKKKSELNISKFLRYVPYRFLSPWIKDESNAAVIQASENFSANGALYMLCKEGGRLKVRVHPQWVPYLKRNYEILRSFALWSLTKFVQASNPNVPNISSKLVRPENRESLARQTKFWKTVMKGGPVKSIYTGEELPLNKFALDHFLPWSFVAHDLLWNLTPIENSINSSKSDKLPDLKFLDSLVMQHKHALNYLIETQIDEKSLNGLPGKEYEGTLEKLLIKKFPILEDYSSLGLTALDIAWKPGNVLKEKFTNTFVPLEQIARDMGFEDWKF